MIKIKILNTTTIRMKYDAFGNRVVKENPKHKQKEIYIRDAQGSILALYQVKDDSLYTREFYMYGSNRLGYLEDEVFLGKKCIGKFCNIIANPANPMPFIGTQKILPTLPPVVIQPVSSSTVSVVFGKKRYELSDWLGNVRVVINDMKTPVNIGATTVGYKAQVVSVTDYYSFGSTIKERTYTYNTPYRFSFNGKEDIRDQRWYQDYGARWYNKVLGRFISPDPLIVGQKKYVWLSVYQFASNRPIDGIDMDGLEYATFWIYIQKNKVVKINITTDYQLKDKNTLGPGVQYNYITINEKNPYKIEKFEMKFERNRYGIYQGERNPKIPEIGGDPNNLKDTYILPPIDEADANAMQHDKDYDKYNLRGFSGVMDARSSKANEDYIKRAETIIEKYKKGDKDYITGKPVTKEAADAAKFGMKWFKIAESLKNIPKVETPKQ